MPKPPDFINCQATKSSCFTTNWICRRANCGYDAAAGWLIDPADLKAAVDGVLADIDHHYLNELPDLENPSTETICRYLRDRLAARLAGRVEVEIWENPSVGCATEAPRR